jgi:HlyD family type I secretion membrane fusion protein
MNFSVSVLTQSPDDPPSSFEPGRRPPRLSAKARRNAGALTFPLQQPLAPASDLVAWRRQARSLGLVLAIFSGACVLWAGLAPLSGAIVAAGVVKTEQSRKILQHQEGGIVAAILVRDGQRVKAGEPLVEIGDVRVSASNSIFVDRLASESVRRARLQAELALSPDFTFPQPDGGAERAAEYLARERALFAAQRRSLEQQVAVLQTQIQETERQIQAQESQVAATLASLGSAREELEMNRNLVKEGFIQRTRLLALERVVSDYEIRLGEFQGNLAQARQRIEDYRLRIVLARNQYQQKAAAELKEAVARIDELQEQLRATTDQVGRLVVRSPVDGAVMALRVTAPGQAIGPREPILEVVPLQEKLVVEARVKPDDVDHVRIGSDAEVRLTAFEQRKMPTLMGKVVAVSPDRVTDPQSGLSWFTVQVEVDPGPLRDLPKVGMQTGMAAEVFVTTPDRSLLDYLLQPLYDSARRGMREP